MLLSQNYKALLSALKSLAGTTVIATSWLAGTKDWPLPAVILDPENPSYETLTEDGVLYETSTRMSIAALVAIDESDIMKTITALDALGWKVAQVISQTFPGKSIRIDLPTIDYMPFGKTQRAFGCVYFVTVSDSDL